MYSMQTERQKSSQSLNDAFIRADLQEDYQRDHEFIVSTISSALKNRDYKTAAEFVERYRSVASNDPSFRVLAQMSDDAYSHYAQAHDALLLLEATPEHDYETRANLYQQLLAIEPDHPEYVAGLRTCTEKIREMYKDDGMPSQAMLRLQDTLLEKDRKIQQCRRLDVGVLKLFSGFVWFFLAIGMINTLSNAGVSFFGVLFFFSLFIAAIYGGFRMMKASLNAELFPGTFIPKNNKFMSPVTIFMVMLATLSLISLFPLIFG